VTERDNLEDLGVDGRIISKLRFKKWGGSTDWIDLAQGREMWLAFVNAVLNFWVS